MKKEISDLITSNTRSIDYMARLIKNKPQNQITPNFSLLLGAGCSSSSNIQNASELIRKWKIELYENNENSSDKPTNTDIDKFLETQEWYKKENEYASIFENLYEIPCHRKQFIESEITNKTPNIGYGYLIKLIEDKFFNTIFTTNFDDLLQEAFYTYGKLDNRPIVCAHDSSIDSISPFSKRPKIIKLHGDFLHDNLHAVPGELTELEINMDRKLNEFAVFSGLIVIGYAGNDDSIMEALQKISKSKDNYKHGIFWCYRNKEDIPSKIEKLKDFKHLFFIKIEGFDELMCTLATRYKLTDDTFNFSIDDNSKKKLIESIIENELLNKTKSMLLKNKIEEIKNNYEKMELKNEINTSKNSNDYKSIKGEEELSINDQNLFDNIQRDINLGEYNSAKETIKKLIAEFTDEKIKNRLKIFLGEIYYRKKEYNKARNIISELITENPYKEYLYLNLIACSPNYNEKLEIINKAIINCPYVNELYDKKYDILNYIDLNTIGEINSKPNEKINKTLLEGIKYSNSIESNCWDSYFSYNYRFAKQQNTEALENCKNILKDYNERFPHHFKVISKQINLKELNKEPYSTIDKYIKENRTENNKEDDIKYDLCRLKYAYNTKDFKNIYQVITRCDNKYQDSQSYTILKAEVFYDIFAMIDKSIEILETFIAKHEKKKNQFVFEKLIQYYLNIKDKTKINEILLKAPNKKELEDKYKEKYLAIQNNWEEIIASSEKQFKLDKDESNYFSQKSHALLMLGKYTEAYTLTHPQILKTNNPILSINCELADSLIRKDKSRSQKKRDRIKLIANSKNEDKSIIAAASAILKETDKMIDNIRKDLQSDFSNVFLYKSYFVFTKYNEEITKRVNIVIDEVREELNNQYLETWAGIY